MKKLLIILPLLVATGTYGESRRALRLQNQAQKLQPGNRPNALRRPAMRDAMLFFYVTQFQKQLEISPEVYEKILPIMEGFVQNRLDISQRRTRAINQIRQAINRGAGDDELSRLAHEVDAADVEAQNNQDKFLGSVDPLLTPKQQARLRLFQVNADNQLRQYLNTVQSSNRGGRGQQPAPQPEK
jgi:hypothetical protein